MVMRLGAVLIEGNDGFKRWLQKSFLLRPEFIDFPGKRVFSHDNVSMLAFEPVEKPGQGNPVLNHHLFNIRYFSPVLNRLQSAGNAYILYKSRCRGQCPEQFKRCDLGIKEYRLPFGNNRNYFSHFLIRKYHYSEPVKFRCELWGYLGLIDEKQHLLLPH